MTEERRPRDSQRSALYRAEKTAFGSRMSAGANATRVVKGKTQIVPRGVGPSGRGSWSGTHLPNGTTRWEKVRGVFVWNDHALRTVADCQAFVNEVAASYRVKPWRVTDGRSARHAAACADYTIRLPRWARTRLVILHECAHHLRPKGTAAHGPEYARTFLELVYEFEDEDTAAILEAAFYTGGVKVADPAKGLTPYHRAVTLNVQTKEA